MPSTIPLAADIDNESTDVSDGPAAEVTRSGHNVRLGLEADMEEPGAKPIV